MALLCRFDQNGQLTIKWILKDFRKLISKLQIFEDKSIKIQRFFSLAFHKSSFK